MASIGRKMTSLGVVISAISLVKIQMVIRAAQSENPEQMQNVLARLGFSGKSEEASLMIVGYQYAVLRRPFPEVSGTSMERKKRALLLWFVLMFGGLVLGVMGFVMEALGTSEL
jgi:hypothetical protein